MASSQPEPSGAGRPPRASGQLAGLLGTHRLVVGVLAGLALLLGISFPLALAHDRSVDVDRSGYKDALAVARLQTALLDGGEPAQELEVGPGESVMVGEDTFTPSAGNTVVAIAAGGGFCVQVTNEDQDVRSWTYDSLDEGAPYDDRAGGACGG